jgi:trehalose synthase-fused probable maltokinase
VNALKAGDASLDQMSLLGKRIGEMHKALGAPVDDPAFKPQPITRADLEQWHASIAKELDDTIAKASAKDPALGAKLAAAKPKLLARLDELNRIVPSGMKTRIHGDLHLGQVLSRDHDWVALDFEGEPARTKEERRGFYAPLRDVAGMLRSFHYAEATARAEGAEVPEGWAKQAGQAFVAAYREAVGRTGLMPKDEAAFSAILDAVELEKALYEVRYELMSRPQMVAIPASRVLEMAL